MLKLIAETMKKKEVKPTSKADNEEKPKKDWLFIWQLNQNEIVDSITKKHSEWNMKTCKVVIEIELEADNIPETPDEAIKEAIYEYLLELIEDDSLDFVVQQ